MQCCFCIFCNSAWHHAWLHGFLFVVLMCMLVVVTTYYIMSNDHDFHCPSIHLFILMKIVLKAFTKCYYNYGKYVEEVSVTAVSKGKSLDAPLHRLFGHILLPSKPSSETKHGFIYSQASLWSIVGMRYVNRYINCNIRTSTYAQIAKMYSKQKFACLHKIY